MITKELIRAGLENKAITIGKDFYGCIGLCCKIGDNAFYFVGMEDESLSVQEYWQSYTMDMTVDMLYDILKDDKTAEENGLDCAELEYYELFLKQACLSKA